MKHLLPLLALGLFTGCTTYTKLSVSDLQGEPISEWIAEGRVKKAENGYTIRAIERTAYGATTVTNRYPNGRVSYVVGPNITRQKIDKPDWLVALDGE